VGSLPGGDAQRTFDVFDVQQVKASVSQRGYTEVSRASEYPTKQFNPDFSFYNLPWLLS